MCGRFAVVDNVRKASGLEIVADPAGHFQPRYNIAPSASITVLAFNRDEKLAAVDMRWGLVPRWSKGGGGGYSLFNARSETIREKPSYAKSFMQRRAVVPANSYYEWQLTGTGAKQPWQIAPATGGLMYFASIWDMWRSAEGEILLSTAIVTTRSIDSVESIHERMPVILTEAEVLRWLTGRSADPELQRYMTRGSGLELGVRRLHPRIGNAHKDSADLIEFI